MRRRDARLLASEACHRCAAFEAAFYVGLLVLPSCNVLLLLLGVGVAAAAPFDAVALPAGVIVLPLLRHSSADLSHHVPASIQDETNSARVLIDESEVSPSQSDVLPCVAHELGPCLDLEDQLEELLPVSYQDALPADRERVRVGEKVSLCGSHHAPGAVREVNLPKGSASVQMMLSSRATSAVCLESLAHLGLVVNEVPMGSIGGRRDADGRLCHLAMRGNVRRLDW